MIVRVGANELLEGEKETRASFGLETGIIYCRSKTTTSAVNAFKEDPQIGAGDLVAHRCSRSAG